MGPKKQFKTIDEYIKTFPEDVQRVLEKMRQTIKRAVPQAEETISYQIPTFKLKGSYLVHFAAFRKHIGLYPPAPKEFKKEVSSYEGPKGNLKFPIHKPIPLDLLKRIVRYRVKEILEESKKKSQ
ncbi:MAG TPA: DUF1801 domain-containing protein [Candidatus Bathyarchaeia archaeon]|nr:DUF1801 domain-containing protein [Candidatus Bathyarchaeia archaeon]